MIIPRIVTISLAIMLSLTAFAQRGGGGGGRGNGGNNNWGGNNWGNYQSAVNDSTPMVRTGGSLYWTKGRGSNNPIRESDLQECLGEERYADYEAARQLFIKGDNRENMGVLLYIPTAVVTLIAAVKHTDEPELSRTLFISAGTALIPATTLYAMGQVKKRHARQQLDQIAAAYNKELELKEAAKHVQVELSPTAMFTGQNQLSFGASLLLHF